jgi:hypothetical protein
MDVHIETMCEPEIGIHLSFPATVGRPSSVIAILERKNVKTAAEAGEESLALFLQLLESKLRDAAPGPPLRTDSAEFRCFNFSLWSKTSNLSQREYPWHRPVI